MVSESPSSQRLNSSQKRMILYFGVLLVALVWVYFPENHVDDLDSAVLSEPVSELGAEPLASSAGLVAEGIAFARYLLGFHDESVGELDTVPVALPSPSPSPIPSDLTKKEIEQFEAAFEPMLARLRVFPAMVSQPPWVALENIEGWYAVPAGVSENELFSYLQHERLWVRLAALQFAVSVGRDFSAIVYEAQYQIVRNESRSQVRRFLKRAEKINPEAYYKMREVLKI